MLQMSLAGFREALEEKLISTHRAHGVRTDLPAEQSTPTPRPSWDLHRYLHSGLVIHIMLVLCIHISGLPESHMAIYEQCGSCHVSRNCLLLSWMSQALSGVQDVRSSMESVLAEEEQDRHFTSDTAFLRHPHIAEQVCRPFNHPLIASALAAL